MAVITGGSGRPSAATGAEPVADAASNEERVRAALLACVARWGLTKTTIEDVAREAGLSRATVYRLHPGGKQAILDAVVAAELADLGSRLSAHLERIDRLDDALVEGIHLAATHLDAHPALSTLAEHDPDVVARIVAFDRLDALLDAAGALTAPLLVRFVGERAREVAVWVGRLVVSYLTTPSPLVDLCRREDVETVVRTFVLPGLRDVPGLPDVRAPEPVLSVRPST